MSEKNVVTTIRIPENLKIAMSKQLNELGLNMNSYFVLAAKQLVLQKRVPFEIKSEPSDTTESGDIDD